jgi:hypothetical protein
MKRWLKFLGVSILLHLGAAVAVLGFLALVYWAGRLLGV